MLCVKRKARLSQFTSFWLAHPHKIFCISLEYFSKIYQYSDYYCQGIDNIYKVMLQFHCQMAKSAREKTKFTNKISSKIVVRALQQRETESESYVSINYQGPRKR
jgi:hypothetical protein